MATKQEQIKKFKELWALIRESITRKEFEDNFKRVLDFVLKLKETNKKEVENIKKLSLDLLEKLKGNNSINISRLKDEFIEIANKTFKEQENGLNFLRDKAMAIREFKDGKRGKRGHIGPQGPTGSPDTPEAIANKLEELKGAGRLKIEAILDLEKRLKGLEERPIGRGGGARKSVYTKRINLTSQCNGTLKEFLLPKDTISVIGVWGTQFPITFDEADFSFEGHTLTLTDEVGAPQTDQTLFCLIQTLFYG